MDRGENQVIVETLLSAEECKGINIWFLKLYVSIAHIAAEMADICEIPTSSFADFQAI